MVFDTLSNIVRRNVEHCSTLHHKYLFLDGLHLVEDLPMTDMKELLTERISFRVSPSTKAEFLALTNLKNVSSSEMFRIMFNFFVSNSTNPASLTSDILNTVTNSSSDITGLRYSNLRLYLLLSLLIEAQIGKDAFAEIKQSVDAQIAEFKRKESE